MAAPFFLAILAATTFIACGRRPPQSAETVKRAAKGVIAIATRHSEDGSITLCSGALVAPNLVLTARHCVTRAITATPACDVHGTSHNGVQLGNDEDPSFISIYTGAHVDVSVDAPRAYASRTIHPTTRVLCDSDVAFIVLDRSLDDVETLPMRLDAPVEAGEYVMPVGFGGGFIGDIGTRVPRPASPVLTVGPGHNSSTGAVLGPHEFEVDEATCRGDSGGPALDVLSGQVVGVVSRGRSCFSDGNHVYTRIDAYASLAREALHEAHRELQEHLAALSTPIRQRP